MRDAARRTAGIMAFAGLLAAAPVGDAGAQERASRIALDGGLVRTSDNFALAANGAQLLGRVGADGIQDGEARTGWRQTEGEGAEGDGAARILIDLAGDAPVVVGTVAIQPRNWLPGGGAAASVRILRSEEGPKGPWHPFAEATIDPFGGWQAIRGEPAPAVRLALELTGVEGEGLGLGEVAAFAPGTDLAAAPPTLAEALTAPEAPADAPAATTAGPLEMGLVGWSRRQRLGDQEPADGNAFLVARLRFVNLAPEDRLLVPQLQLSTQLLDAEGGVVPVHPLNEATSPPFWGDLVIPPGGDAVRSAVFEVPTGSLDAFAVVNLTASGRILLPSPSWEGDRIATEEALATLEADDLRLAVLGMERDAGGAAPLAGDRIVLDLAVTNVRDDFRPIETRLTDFLALRIDGTRVLPAADADPERNQVAGPLTLPAAVPVRIRAAVDVPPEAQAVELVWFGDDGTVARLLTPEAAVPDLPPLGVPAQMVDALAVGVVDWEIAGALASVLLEAVWTGDPTAGSYVFRPERVLLRDLPTGTDFALPEPRSSAADWGEEVLFPGQPNRAWFRFALPEAATRDALALVVLGQSGEAVIPLAPAAEVAEPEALPEPEPVPPDAEPIPTIALSATSVEPGSRLTVTIAAAGGLAPDAWFGIVPADTPHGAEAEGEAAALSFDFLDGAESAREVLRAPVTPGAYEVRLYGSDADGRELVSAAFTVTGAEEPETPAPEPVVATPEPAPEPDPPPAPEPPLEPAEDPTPAPEPEPQVAFVLEAEEVVVGQPVTVRLEVEGALDETAWVALVPADTPRGDGAAIDVADLAWAWVRDLDGAWTVTAPAAPGRYEIRLVEDTAGGPDIAWAAFEAVPQPPPRIEELAVAGGWARPGEQATVRFVRSGTWEGSARLALVPFGTPDGDSALVDQHDIAYAYVSGIEDEAWSFTAPQQVGAYEVRVLAGTGSGEEMARLRLDVRTSPPLPDTLPDLTSEEPVDVARQAYGAVPFGGIDREHLTDGVPQDYRGDGYTTISSGQAQGLVFDRAYPLESIRFLLWDLDDRTYAYRLEGSRDLEEWEVLEDRTSGGATGWQEVELDGTAWRALRIHSLGSTLNEAVHVIEIEAWAREGLPVTATGYGNEPFYWWPSTDLAYDFWGARVAAVSSGEGASATIDGDLGEDADAPAWLADADDPAPQIVIAFRDGLPGTFLRLNLAVDATGTHDRPHVVRVETTSAADPATAGDKAWRPVETIAFDAGAPIQSALFDDHTGTAVRLTVLSSFGQGDGRIALSEIGVISDIEDARSPALPHVQPGFEGGINIAAAAVGGSVARTTGLPAGQIDTTGLIDNAVGEGRGMTVDNAPLPFEIVLDLAGDRPALIGAVGIDPWAGSPERWRAAPRRAELLVSTEGPDRGFEKVLDLHLSPLFGDGLYAFPPRRAGWVMLRVLDTYGDTILAIGEVTVLEIATGDRPTVLPGGGPPLNSPYFGGNVALGSGLGRFALLDAEMRGGLAWTAEPGWPLPVELVFGFEIGTTPLVDRVILTPGSPLTAPESWPARVKVETSATSPIDGFETVADVTVPQTTEPVPIRFEPREVRYVRVSIVETWGGVDPTLGGVDIPERIVAGRQAVTAIRYGSGRAADTEEEDAADVETGPPEVDEREPNDTLARANPLPEDRAFAATIAPPTDRDLFAIDTRGVSVPGFRVSVEEAPVLRTRLALLDEAGRPVDERPLYEESGGEAAFFWSRPPGLYHLAIDRPLSSIVVLSDLSASTTPARAEITQALRAFVGQTTEYENVLIAGFCDGIHQATGFTTDREELAAAVEEVNFECGGTDLYGAMGQALDWLAGREGTKAILMVTDGYHWGDNMGPLYALWPRIGEGGVRIYSIGYGDGLYQYVYPPNGEDRYALAAKGAQFLEAVARATGASYYEAPSSSDVERVTAEVAAALRDPSLYELTLDVSEGAGALGLVEVGENIPGVSAPRQMEIIFDASGSMWARNEEGLPRIAVAREVIRAVAASLPPETELALRVYGHRLPREPKARSCQDTELVLPFAPLDPDRLVAAVDALQPSGQTPIGLSLAWLTEDFEGREGPKSVILITDGIETCDPEFGDEFYPPEIVQLLIDAGYEMTVSVVSFDIGDSETRDFLVNIAETGNGQYFDAGSTAELQAALEDAIRATYTVTDSAGTEVASGRVGGEPVSLAEGLYTVSLATDPPRLIDEVEVVADRETRLLLDKEGDRIGVQVEDHPLGIASADPAPDADETESSGTSEPPPSVPETPTPEPETAEPPEPAPPAAPVSTVGSEDVARAQTLLAALGYDPGPVDGDFGRRTAAAIQAFQTDRGGEVDGSLTAAMLASIEAAAVAAGVSTTPPAEITPAPAVEAPPAPSTPAQPVAAPQPQPASQIVSGAARVVSTDRIDVGGQVVRLAGLVGVSDPGIVQQLQTLVNREGGRLSCEPVAGGYACRTPTGFDLGHTILYNGAARLASGAPPEYADAEARARSLGLGVWR